MHTLQLSIGNWGVPLPLQVAEEQTPERERERERGWRGVCVRERERGRHSTALSPEEMRRREAETV